ncbi:MAG TPA: hypothetical protein VM686_01455, partial [Polyangiaceae bacterium]|nr:hypothetical protein [Polyangiaceae bacterium]
FAERVRARVSLAFEGLSQLFNEGGFSGAVREELNRVENAGLKDFLVNVFLWANRIKNFFSGIADGFGAGVEAARPAIDGFLAALRSLGSALGILSERDDAGTAADKFRQFGSAGERVGQVLAKVFEFSARVLTGLVELGTGVVGAWEAIAPGVEVVRGSFAQLGTNLTQLTGVLGSQSGAIQSTGSLWSAFGNVVAFVIGIAITIIGVFVSTVSLAASVVSGALGAVMSLFSGLADVVTGVVFVIGGIFTGRWADIWTGMKLVAFGVIDAVAGAVLELVGALGGAVDALAGLLGKNTQFQKSIRDFKEQARADTLRDFGLEGQSFTPGQARPPVPAGAAPPAAPAVAAVRALTPPLSSSPSVPAPTPAPPVTVNLQVDGETLARAVHRADQDAATRSFSPVPAY